MNMRLPALERLTEQFRHLPGIGRKTAERLAYGIVDMDIAAVNDFVAALLDVKENVKLCPRCQNLSEGGLCPVCADPARDQGIICVVEDVKAALAMEKVRGYNGTYHILHGTISLINDRTPDKLKIKELSDRVKEGGVREVILATNPTVDGETTAMYISRLLKPTGVRVTRLAYGIPVGSELEYADEMTLLSAMDGRKDF